MRIYSLFFCLFFTIPGLFAQSRKIKEKIVEVESGLLLQREVVFKDSPVKKYHISERMKFYNVPSVSIAVINNGTIEWAKAYGFADLQEQRKADVNTLYQAASISKSINAFCVMKLVQEGKLSLDEDIRSYLKTWDFPDNDHSKGKKITLRNLLSHTAGLSTSGFMGYLKTDSIPSINQVLDGKRPANSGAVIPLLPPNVEVRYSGGGTTVIRKILEDNVNNNYVELLQQEVLGPLNMKHSTFLQPLPSVYKNVATAYTGLMKEVDGKYRIYPELAPDGLWITSTDLAKFILSIQSSLNGKPSLLKKEIAEEMLRPVMMNEPSALGVFIINKAGEKYFTHGGANVGFRTNYYGSMLNGNGVVVLTNADNGAMLIDEIVNSVAEAYNWKSFYNPLVKTLYKASSKELEKFVGVYSSEDPALNIVIAMKNGELWLTAKRTEKLYPTNPNTFFLMSSPQQQVVFTSSNNDGINDGFEVRDGDKVIIKAKKK